MTFENPGGYWNAKQRLQLSERTMERIEDRREIAIRWQIAAYVRKHAPEQTSNMPDEALMNIVIEAESVATNLGFKNHTSYELWTLLVVLTNKKIYQNQLVMKDLYSRYQPDKIINFVFAENAGIPIPTGELS